MNSLKEKLLEIANNKPDTKKRGKKTKKEIVKEKLIQIISASQTIEELYQNLARNNLIIDEERGVNIRVFDLSDSSRKNTHRLSKMGIQDQYIEKKKSLLRKKELKKDLDFDMTKEQTKDKVEELDIDLDIDLDRDKGDDLLELLETLPKPQNQTESQNEEEGEVMYIDPDFWENELPKYRNGGYW